jgi:hypothetical protein
MDQQPDGNDPSQMIGYIDPNATPKVKTYLTAAKAIVVNPQTADILKKMLTQGQDPAMTLATFIGKTIDTLETKLGPLEQQEHDQVAVHIAGWLVSSLQHMGMPGLDDQGARHDLLGRILQALDQLTGGDQPQDQGAPQQPPDGAVPSAPQGSPQDPSQAPPLAQFGGP